MKGLLLALVAAVTLAIPATASAAPFRVTHWEMELSMIRHGMSWDNGDTTSIDDAYCTGTGRHLTRPARYSTFTCQVVGYTSVPGCEAAELSLDTMFDWWDANCNLEDRFTSSVTWSHGDWTGTRWGE